MLPFLNLPCSAWQVLVQRDRNNVGDGQWFMEILRKRLEQDVMEAYLKRRAISAFELLVNPRIQYFSIRVKSLLIQGTPDMLHRVKLRPLLPLPRRQILRPHLMIITETRTCIGNVRNIVDNLTFDGCMDVRTIGYQDGIWLLWKSNMATVVRVRASSISWLLSAVYASPRLAESKLLWSNLKTVASKHKLPWIVTGDFNEVLSRLDKKRSRFYWSMKEYQEILDQEVDLWTMKSRVEWLVEGERNTSFFHLTTVKRRSHNRIGLNNNFSTWSISKEGISSIIRSYFHDLFRSSREVNELSPLHSDLQWPRTLDERNSLTAPLSEVEIAQISLNGVSLKKILELFDFPCNWRNLILDCISSSTLSALNGEQLPMVEPSRGIRQGDLLSPYLFITCMEFLSLQIHKACEEKKWKPIRASRSGPNISGQGKNTGHM
ncbi:hypothetical protein J1N35_042329 [Gossypium stocksii]|uniref:Reverse transcriptase domain-containing protein n=1 Tax=Gossypium stocksii TaxID=47602 RepID=A0A9D3ZKA9_9ROSI|nr:hypothetical protein J1N35_042329 [Gossypium stocksii]